MITQRAQRTAALAALCTANILAVACRHTTSTSAEPVTTTVETSTTTTETSAPVVSTSALSAPVMRGGAPASAGPAEPTVSIHAQDSDVRPLLKFIAQRGGYSLVFPPNLERRVTVELNDVPVSAALKFVLTAAGLSLEGTTSATPSATTRPVVFYQLPANVDSLSVEAIMKRFNVGRSIAEMIVESRQKP